ncbi:MAG: hypothetical protein Q4A34_00705 [Candidatus Saccharibacteria bacterium]|nr:hypothetical protein [Candidatus Saccharibacteria bacterium]
MIRKLYSFYDLPFNHDMCHVFEHLVLRTFLLAAREAGNHRAFIGAVNGQTLGSSIFFTIEVHDESTRHLFERILTTPRLFSEDVIKQSIRHIEAETLSTIRIADTAQLYKDLLAMHHYINGNNRVMRDESQLSVSHTPGLFQRMIVSAEITDTSDHMTKIFYALYPVIMDIIRDVYFDTISSYPTGASSFTAYLDGTVAVQEYVIRELPDEKAAPDTITRALRDFDSHFYAPHIAQLANSFRRDATFTFLPLYCYEKTEVRTSIEELANLITSQHLRSLMDAVHISVKPAA